MFSPCWFASSSAGMTRSPSDLLGGFAFASMYKPLEQNQYMNGRLPYRPFLETCFVN